MQGRVSRQERFGYVPHFIYSVNGSVQINVVNKMHCSVCQQCNTKMCHNLYNPESSVLLATKFNFPAPPPCPARPARPGASAGGRAAELAGNWTCDIISARRAVVAGGRWPRQGWAGRSSSSSRSSSAPPPAPPSPSKTSPGVVASQCHVKCVSSLSSVPH